MMPRSVCVAAASVLFCICDTRGVGWGGDLCCTLAAAAAAWFGAASAGEARRKQGVYLHQECTTRSVACSRGVCCTCSDHRTARAAACCAVLVGAHTRVSVDSVGLVWFACSPLGGVIWRRRCWARPSNDDAMRPQPPVSGVSTIFHARCNPQLAGWGSLGVARGRCCCCCCTLHVHI